MSLRVDYDERAISQAAAFLGGGVRLGGQKLGVQVGGSATVARRPAELGAVGSLPLAEQQIVRFALDRLTGLEAESPGAGAPPAAGWFSPGFAGLDVVAGGVLGRAAVDLLPDVVKVIALAQGEWLIGQVGCYPMREQSAAVVRL